MPNGRKDRTCVIVDVRKTKSAKAADIFVQIKPRRDFEGLWTLRALAQGVSLDPESVKEETGVELAVWKDLMDRMRGTVLEAETHGRLLVETGRGTLRIGAVKPAGRKRMSTADWVRGRGVAAGDSFE